jgi:hypothetical protein
MAPIIQQESIVCGHGLVQYNLTHLFQQIV